MPDPDHHPDHHRYRSPDTRIVLTTSLTPALDRALRPGAYRCLALLRSLAGHARCFATFTCSIATQLGRVVNTVRAYRDELVQAGYISWTVNPRTSRVTVTILETVEPPSRRAQLERERQAERGTPMPSLAISMPWDRGVQKSAPVKSSSPYPCTVVVPVEKWTTPARVQAPAQAIRCSRDEQVAAMRLSRDDFARFYDSY